MSDLAALIRRAIDLKQGDKEFALFFTDYSDEPWSADIGNPSSAVMLGEVRGDYSADGASAEQAVERLIAKLPQ